jgi:hypothetical protein
VSGVGQRRLGFPRTGLYKWHEVDGLARRFAESCECPASPIAYCGPCVYCQLASAIVEIDRLRTGADPVLQADVERLTKEAASWRSMLGDERTENTKVRAAERERCAAIVGDCAGETEPAEAMRRAALVVRIRSGQ